MVEIDRRQLLRATVGSVVAGGAGCLARQSGDETESPATTDDGTPDGSLTDWERSTDCDRTPTGMYDSVISVEQVATDIGDGYTPIQFVELTPEETAILRVVVEEGGYGTCSTSEGFDQFVERITTHWEKQRDTAEEPRKIYLVRDGTYYRLYVEKQDQVYSH